MITQQVKQVGDVRKAIEMLPLRSLAEILVKHHDLHEGKYDLAVEFQIGVGPVGPDQANMLPGAIVAVSKIGLVPTTLDGAGVVDAGQVNPAKGKTK